MANELKTQEIVKLSDREHIILRPGMYCGSISENEEEGYFVENDKFVWKKVKYIPGLLKIINEIIDNSVDEGVRTNFKFSNKIKIKIENNAITVIDNGRGIPIKKTDKDEEQPPVLAFCHARAGSNFTNDSERTTCGMNGIGSFITNVFSKKFNVKTADGKHCLSLVCRDNLEHYKWDISSSTQQYTAVYFEPDLKRFGITSENIPPIYIDLIKQRLINLSMSYPDIKFSINDETIKIPNVEKFIEMFGENYEIIDEYKDWFAAVVPNDADEMRFYSFANGLHLKEGGTHVQLISYEIANALRDKLVKRFKEIKPGDIRSKLLFVVFFNNFKNMKFDSQTKVKLTNAAPEINDYLGKVEWDKFAYKIYKNEKLLDPIIETFKIKEEFKNRQQLKQLQSTGSKSFYVEKYIAAIKENKYAVILEGDSALGSLMPVLGREIFGYFPIRGKPLNSLEVKLSRIIENEEIKSIVEILGLDLTKDKQNMNYENVVFATDADLDGICIRALLLTLFYRFCPDIIKSNKIKFLRTPLITAAKSNKIIDYFFNFEDYNIYINKHKDNKNIDYHYYKGLGTWETKDLKGLITKDGLSNFIVDVNYDANTDKLIREWMSRETSDVRKEYLRDKAFSIDFI